MNGSPKTGGRKKGTPNKPTLALQELLFKHDFDIVSELKELMPNLSPDKRADVLLSLMQYIFPKRKALEVGDDRGDDSPRIVITIPSNGREAPGTELTPI